MRRARHKHAHAHASAGRAHSSVHALLGAAAGHARALTHSCKPSYLSSSPAQPVPTSAAAPGAAQNQRKATPMMENIYIQMFTRCLRFLPLVNLAPQRVSNCAWYWRPSRCGAGHRRPGPRALSEACCGGFFNFLKLLKFLVQVGVQGDTGF